MANRETKILVIDGVPLEVTGPSQEALDAKVAEDAAKAVEDAAKPPPVPAPVVPPLDGMMIWDPVLQIPKWCRAASATGYCDALGKDV